MKPLLFKLGKQLRQLYYVLLLTGLLLNASTLPAQSLNNDVKNKLETISQYAISANDNTDHYLQQLNYERPANIAAAEWNHFPSLRKIDIAYKAAQANAQGQQFIEAFAKA